MSVCDFVLRISFPFLSVFFLLKSLFSFVLNLFVFVECTFIKYKEKEEELLAVDIEQFDETFRHATNEKKTI